MNYLFFDIECSNGKNICSFGYIIVDEEFNILKKEDVVINPEAKFKIGRNEFNPELDLAYSLKDFQCHKNFAWYYKKIKAILTQKDIIIMGHSVSSDIWFLDVACKRYKLENIKITAYDTQNIFADYAGDKKQLSLEDIASKLEINYSNLQVHKSCDDAHLTMLVTKKICESLAMSIDELLALTNDDTKTNKTVTLKELAMQYPKRKEWPSICFSETIEIDILNVAKQVFDKGYNFINKASECNYFVYSKDIGMRDLTCDEIIAQGANIKKISILEFEKMTNVMI